MDDCAHDAAPASGDQAEFVGTANVRVAWMPRVVPLKPQEVVAILKHFGFTEVRQSGSHKQFRHDDGRATTVPFHKGRDVSPTLIRKIAQDIAVDVPTATQDQDLGLSVPVA